MRKLSWLPAVAAFDGAGSWVLAIGLILPVIYLVWAAARGGERYGLGGRLVGEPAGQRAQHRGARARVLGDPGLLLAYRVPGRHAYIDGASP